MLCPVLDSDHTDDYHEIFNFLLMTQLSRVLSQQGIEDCARFIVPIVNFR